MSELTLSSELLQISPEVQEALNSKKPIVALESTIISHGMPFPQNAQTAIEVEETIRKYGAVPATIAIIGGVMKVGLSKDEIELLGREGHSVTKVSRRDLPFVVAAGKNGATTVASTMIIAALAGIKVFATGGIGGVHRGAQHTFDISADLQELAHTNVTVICAGAKSILDLGLTTEYLETFGVPLIGYQTKALPAFSAAPVRLRSVSVWTAQRDCPSHGGEMANGSRRRSGCCKPNPGTVCDGRGEN